MKNGNELSFDFFVKNRFNTPILIENKEELGFIMPNADQIDLTKIEQIVGGEYSIDVIDVERQQTFPMSIKELNDYFKQVPRTKIYNLISFEISKTKWHLKFVSSSYRLVYILSVLPNNFQSILRMFSLG